MVASMKTQTPQLSRDHWATHVNYPSQVLLLGSHENFRNVSRRLVDEARHPDRLTWVGHIYRRWISAMRSHEAYEERKLYPYLARRWGVSFAACEDGHETLHGRDDAVRAILREVDAGGTGAELGERLATALQRHDDVLVAHLEVEENAVIPLLLALSPAEFTRYSHNPLSVSLRDLETAEQARSDH
ncbi:MAG: hypothetical protein ACI9MR_003841 [Myxococcota bacterium]|jgi:hypothetical protein